MPRKLDSLLARFEETIEKNNAVGVCSGMYLTNLASTSSTTNNSSSNISRRHSAEESAVPKTAKAGRRTSLESSLPQIQPGTYRNMLKTADATVSTADTADSDDWDPFNDATTGPARDRLDESFSSIGDCSAASFMDDDVYNDDQNDDDDDENHSTTPSKTSKIRRERTKDKKSSGRRSSRMTKSEKQRRASMSRASSKSNLQVTASLENPGNKEDDDDDNINDDEDDGFALTYVSARDKFTALAKQNSDRQLCKQPSRRKLLSGLKMTSKENLMSGGSHHSSTSTQRRTLDRSRSNRSLTKAPVSSTTRRACSDHLLDNVETTKATTTISPKMMIPRSARVSSSNSPPKKSRVSKNNSSSCCDLSKHSCHNLGRTPPLDNDDSGHESPVKPLSRRTSKSIRSISDCHPSPVVQRHEDEAGRSTRRSSSHRQRSFRKSRSEH